MSEPKEKTTSLWPARSRKKSDRVEAVKAAEDLLEEALKGLKIANERNASTYREFFDAHEARR